MLDLLVGIAHVADALFWIGRSIKRLFIRVFMPRSPHCQPLEWGDWFMLGIVALIGVLVILLTLTGA